MSPEHCFQGAVLVLVLGGSSFASSLPEPSASFALGQSEEEKTKPIQSPEDPASRPPFENFLPDLKRNFLGLFSRESVLPTLIGVGSAAAVAPWDDEVASYFLGPNEFPNIGPAGDVLLFAEVIAGGVGALLLLRQSIQDETFRRMAYSMTQALVLNNAVTFALKPIANRERPNRASQFSFPSAHASNAFMTAVIAEHYYGPAAGIPTYAAAVFISVSRLQANEHFMTDLIVGGTIGYIIAKTVVRQESNPRKRITWMPVISPAQSEVSIRVQVRLEK